MQFHTLYNPAPSEPFHCEGVSMTKQSHKDECDINKIVKSYERSGFNAMVPSTIFSGDTVVVTDADFHQAMEVIAKANEAFDDLPSGLRKRFSNDPSQLLAFLQDSANLEEAVKLGLVEAKPEAQVQAPAEPAPAP